MSSVGNSNCRRSPGEVDRRPRFTTPHLPRLDWQMWFAALADDCRRQPWFLRFEARLLEGSPPVLALLREDPFPDRPPRYVRARLYRYRFTRPGAEAWWRREDL
ncbi:MAG: lipase maturation factor family protein, partial [Acidimicrobiia bacterium]